MNLVNMFKALANPKRLEILALLKEPEKFFANERCEIKNGGVCLKSIERKIGLSQSTVSHYINLLYQAQLIEIERFGQWSYCKLNSETLKLLNKEISNMF